LEDLEEEEGEERESEYQSITSTLEYARLKEEQRMLRDAERRVENLERQALQDAANTGQATLIPLGGAPPKKQCREPR